MNDLEFISYFAYFIFIFLGSIFISVYDFQYCTSFSESHVFKIYDSKNPKNINNTRFVIQIYFKLYEFETFTFFYLPYLAANNNCTFMAKKQLRDFKAISNLCI